MLKEMVSSNFENFLSD